MITSTIISEGLRCQIFIFAMNLTAFSHSRMRAYIFISSAWRILESLWRNHSKYYDKDGIVTYGYS